jgi:MFS family permease
LTRKGLISTAGRTVVAATIAAMVLTTSELPLAAAPASQASEGILARVASSDVTDFSSARRRRQYHRRGSAAGLAFMGFAIGTIAGAIAAEQRREYYYDYGYYGPGYYYGGPYYYGRRYYPLY